MERNEKSIDWKPVLNQEITKVNQLLFGLIRGYEVNRYQLIEMRNLKQLSQQSEYHIQHHCGGHFGLSSWERFLRIKPIIYKMFLPCWRRWDVLDCLGHSGEVSRLSLMILSEAYLS